MTSCSDGERGEALETENGLVPEGDGWFVLNAKETPWLDNADFGRGVTFEGEGKVFPSLGINIAILQPGQPLCMYHGEDEQEDFLMLAGEAILLVEGEERPLRQWDFVHCPPWTEHVIVGAGSGPCTVHRGRNAHRRRPDLSRRGRRAEARRGRPGRGDDGEGGLRGVGADDVHAVSRAISTSRRPERAVRRGRSRSANESADATRRAAAAEVNEKV